MTAVEAPPRSGERVAALSVGRVISWGIRALSSGFHGHRLPVRCASSRRNDDPDLGRRPRLYRSFLRGSDRPQHVHTWSESVAMSEDGLSDLLDRRETSETRQGCIDSAG